MATLPEQLTYFVAEKEISDAKDILLLISVAGPLKRSTSETFEKLIKELEEKKYSWVVLNLRDVGSVIERTQFPQFARLQKIIREKPAELRICSIHPELRKILDQAGLLRATEISNNLPAALQSLTPKTG